MEAIQLEYSKYITPGNFEPISLKGSFSKIPSIDNISILYDSPVKVGYYQEVKDSNDTFDVLVLLPSEWDPSVLKFIEKGSVFIRSNAGVEATLYNVLSSGLQYEGVVAFDDGSFAWSFLWDGGESKTTNPYEYFIFPGRNLDLEKAIYSLNLKGYSYSVSNDSITPDVVTVVTKDRLFNIVHSEEQYKKLVNDKSTIILVAKNLKELVHFEGIGITADSYQEAVDYIIDEKGATLSGLTYMYSGAQGMRNLPLHKYFRKSTLVGNKERVFHLPYKVREADYIRQEFLENSAKWDFNLFSVKATLKNMVDSKTIQRITDKSQLYDSLGEKYTPKTFPFNKATKIEGRVLVVRPVGSGSHGGRGIYIATKTEDLKKAAAEYSKKKWKGIVSEYITNPLLFEGKKCHLRCYVIVTSWGKWFVYDKAEIITAKMKYKNSDYSNKAIHDTHGASTGGNYYFPDDWLKYTTNTEQEVSKISFLIKECGERLHRAIKDTIASYKEAKYGYKLLGVDLMFTDKFDPRIIEVNVQPDMSQVFANEKERPKEFQRRLLEWEYESVILPIFSQKKQVVNKRVAIASTRVDKKIIYFQWKVLENDSNTQRFINSLNDYYIVVVAEDPRSVTVKADKVVSKNTRYVMSVEDTYYVCSSIKQARMLYKIFDDDMTVIIKKKSRTGRDDMAEYIGITCYTLQDLYQYITAEKKFDETTTYTVSGSNGLKDLTLHELMKGASLYYNEQRRISSADNKFPYPPSPYVDFMRQSLLKDYTWDREAYQVRCYLKNNVDSESIKSISDKSLLYDTMYDYFEDLSFIPETVNIDNVKKGETWIVRPVGSAACSGKSISIVTTTQELIKAKKEIQDAGWKATVSEYVTNPLLFNGKKFHLRCYLLVTSWGVFSIHKEAKILTGSQEYIAGDYCNKAIHDTHVKSTDKNYIFPYHFDGDKDKISEGLELIGDRLSTVLQGKVNVYKGESVYAYSILGLDLMFTEDYIPKLIEVNTQPGFSSAIYPPDETYEEFEKQLLTWEYETAIYPILKELESNR